jgi:hypothetical protein
MCAATQAHVTVVTVNAGVPTWQNLDGISPFTTLPNLPANSLVVNPNIPSHLYLVADVGTFFSPRRPRTLAANGLRSAQHAVLPAAVRQDG